MIIIIDTPTVKNRNQNIKFLCGEIDEKENAKNSRANRCNNNGVRSVALQTKQQIMSPNALEINQNIIEKCGSTVKGASGGGADFRRSYQFCQSEDECMCSLDGSR